MQEPRFRLAAALADRYRIERELGQGGMYLYFSNTYETTGLDWLRATCGGADVPAFTVDPARQPTDCGHPVPFEVNYFDPSFRFPRNLRLSLGSDLHLPWAMAAAVFTWSTA